MNSILRWILNRYRSLFRKELLGKQHSVYIAGDNVIAPTAWLNKVYVDKATYICGGCYLCNCRIGKYCSIASNVRTVLGRHPTDCFVSTHPSFFSMNSQSDYRYTDRQKFEEIHYIDKENEIAVNIGNDVWIGQGVSILDGVTIGDGAIIGTGAVVLKDVPPYAIVGGIPAKLIRYRFSKEDIQFLLEIKWWDKSEEWIRRYACFFDDIDTFKHFLRHEGGCESV